LAIELHDLTLSALAYGGDALGHLDDGRAAFVPFGLPGERVRIALAEEKERFVRGKLVEVLEPAPERVAPRCKHFGLCGGCHYQHMPYQTQLLAKTEILRDQLVRIGHIVSPPLQPAVPSPSQWNYRNQVQFHVAGDGSLGYVTTGIRKGSPGRVFAVEECHLPEASIDGLWPRLDFDAGTGIERISIRSGSHDEVLVVLESVFPEAPELKINEGISVAQLFGGDCLTLAGDDHVVLDVLGREFRVSAAAFFQVNTAMAGKMVEHVLGHAPTSIGTLLDVYCGVGLFSALLAGRCRRLIGVESSPAACRDFGVNLDEFDNVELYEDAAERALPALKLDADVVLVDPPRAGVGRAALDAIIRMQPKMLIYVSCDPSTLARDARRLTEAGLRLAEARAFDLFPQTYHIESISIFER